MVVRRREEEEGEFSLSHGIGCGNNAKVTGPRIAKRMADSAELVRLSP